MKLYDYPGVIHLHSAFSYDGHAPMASILKDAREAGLSFLLLTDHDHLRAKQEGWEGWHDGVLLVVGQEVSPRFNHYLAFDITDPITYSDDPQGRHPQAYIDRINAQGGFGMIAHPDHEGTEAFHVKQYCWNDWNVHDYAGISVWDFMTDWQKSLTGYLRGLQSFLFPAYFLRGPTKITLERWDALNQIRKTVGIGELDNHASIKKLLGLSFVAFPFRKAFRFIRTHIITQDPFNGQIEHDKQLIFKSLIFGRCYFALEYFRSAENFSFFVEQNGHTYTMGDSLKIAPETQLIASFPSIAQVKLIRNGTQQLATKTNRLVVPIEVPGVYRVEAWLRTKGKTRPWIFSNPIFVQE